MPFFEMSSIYPAMARFVANIELPLRVIGAVVGLVLVILPSASTTWRSVVVGIDLFRWIFEQFSRFGTGALLPLLMFLAFAQIISWCPDMFSTKWNRGREWAVPTARQVL